MKTIGFICLVLIIFCQYQCSEIPVDHHSRRKDCLVIGDEARLELKNHSVKFESISSEKIQFYQQKIENLELVEFFGEEFKPSLYSGEGLDMIHALILFQDQIPAEMIEDADIPRSFTGLTEQINKIKAQFFRRIGKELIIDTNQKRVVYKDVVQDDQTWVKHNFVMYSPSLNCFLVRKHEFDNGLHKNTQGILINKETGKETVLWDDSFSLSPDRKKIAIATFAFGAAYIGKRGLQVFTVTSNGLELFCQIEICDWEPTLVGWTDENQLLIRKFNGSDTELGLVTITESE